MKLSAMEHSHSKQMKDKTEIEDCILAELKLDRSKDGWKELKLKDDFELDSLETIEFLMTLEEVFDIDVNGKDEERFMDLTLGEITDFIEEKKALKERKS